MDNVNHLKTQYVDFVTSFLREGFVDHQFMHLLQLQSVDEPQFLFDILNQFFDASDKIMHQFDNAVEHQHVDAKLKDVVFQFRGANISVGVPRLTRVCIAFENYHGANNFERCLTSFQELKEEYHLVKLKFQALLSLQQRILAAGGSIPVMG